MIKNISLDILVIGPDLVAAEDIDLDKEFLSGQRQGSFSLGYFLSLSAMNSYNPQL